jgi:hypothetical protein
MTLQEFLLEKELRGIETLSDGRLINIILTDGSLYGVKVENILVNDTLITYNNVVLEDNIIKVGELEFDTTSYEML